MKNKIHISVALILTFVLIIGVKISAQAKSELHELIVSGQVTSKESGVPIVNHKVVIKSCNINNRFSEYYKELETNKEGYYFDTISTTAISGSLNVFTYDQNEKIADTVVHFRFLGRSDGILIADFEICFKNQGEIVQARFKAFQKQNGNPLEYKFVDITDNPNIISYLWEFGDGATSKEASPEHTYDRYGLYKVKLHVVVQEGASFFLSEISKRVYSTDVEYYHMGGHAFSEYFPIDKGFAYLYQLDSVNNYLPVDTVTFDTLGYYYFYHVPEGEYVVKIEPRRESQYYGVLLPTYYGDEFFWQDAQLITLNSTSWEYDIKLDIASNISMGNGKIAGNVKFINASKNSGLDDVAEGVQIYLFDKSNNLLTYRYSSSRGLFDFADLVLDGYYIYPEVTGVTSEKEFVQLTPLSPEISNIEISIDVNNVSAIIPGTVITANLISDPYPNPASDKISVSIDENITGEVFLEIYSISGQKLTDIEYDSNVNNIEIPVSSFKNGTYIVRAYNNSISTAHMFVVTR